MKKAYAVPIIFLALLAIFFGYLILVYAEERQELLLGDTGGHISITPTGFNPVVFEIKKGETVRWVNKDNEKHKIVGADFESPILYRGQSYIHTFEKKGIYEYADAFSPGMKGRIIVQ